MTDPTMQVGGGNEEQPDDAVQSLARDLAARDAGSEGSSGDEPRPEVVAEAADEMGA